MKPVIRRLLGLFTAVFALWNFQILAIDPPHDTSNLCMSCHMPHMAPDGDLTAMAGNANLCMSCHQAGGTASTKPFATADQALPWPGLPTNGASTGTSHRWDASAAGHVAFLGGALTPSTGTLLPSGTFTGPYPKTYTITVTNAGVVGTARFNWVATTPGGGAGTNLLTGANVPLDRGVLLSFLDGTGTSFQANDKWNLYVRTDLRQPTNTTLLAHTTGGVATCSACHDEHSQAVTPFDPNAPAYAGSGGGSNRHFMRITNDQDQLCSDCHAARNVTNSLAGSHPVGITVPSNTLHQAPALLPLRKATGQIGCLTCHKMHFSPANDADLLRSSNNVAVCMDCHRQSDTNTPAAHFVTTNSATLWPGGRLGSLLPARTSLSDRGSCANCHAIHGWPDATNTVSHYPKLLADFEENLCLTCHGTNGPAVKQVQADFAKARNHPILNSQQTAGRKVECVDCHNAHMARVGGLVYTNTATAARNQVTGPLRGVSGVTFDYSALTNFQAVATNRFTLIPTSPGATNEYQICFKCHSGYAWLPGSPPLGRSPNGTAASPVETDLAQEFSPNNRSGHPIVTGLNNYPNSLAPKALSAAALKPPWNINVGNQTMLCSDCHDATTTNYVAGAVQGPHGSANQFILRGPNAANWPNVPNSAIATSWCMNCHNNNVGTPHGGDHSGNQCYVCHIVIPHGGKVSRLIATGGGTMPTRYAWNNSLTTVGMTSFTKAAAGGYSENRNCRTSCGHHASGPINESW